MLKRKLLGEVRKGLAQLAAYHRRPGHQLPTFCEGLRLIGENAKGPVRMQLIWAVPGPSPSRRRSAPAHVLEGVAQGALSLLSVSSIRPRERPNWYLRLEIRLRGRRASRGILEALKGTLPVRGGPYRVRRAWASSSRARRSLQAGCPRVRRL